MTDTVNSSAGDTLLDSPALAPAMKNWRASKFYDYDNEIIDFENLEELNRTTNQARKALFKVTEAINKYEREEREHTTLYKRTWRREFLKSIAKTESERKARADLACEDLENSMIAAQQVKDELVRLSHALRIELQTLQAIGNNLRQQYKVV